MLKTTSITFIALICSLLLSREANGDSLWGKVISIHDGDTLQVKIVGEKKNRKIRLMGVDTPEVDFLGFSQGEDAFMARDFLLKILPIGSDVRIEFGSKASDAHERLLGHIYYRDIDINQKLLESGMGYLYFIHPFDKSFYVKYSKAAQLAFINKLGLFSKSPNTQDAPYIFRQTSKNIEGNNLVGNFETKVIYNQKDIEKVPPYLRVFFSDLNTAKKMGYKENL